MGHLVFESTAHILTLIFLSCQNNMNLLWNSHKTRSCEDTEPGLLVVSILNVFLKKDKKKKSLKYPLHVSSVLSLNRISWLLPSPTTVLHDFVFQMSPELTSMRFQLPLTIWLLFYLPPSSWFSFYFPFIFLTPPSQTVWVPWFILFFLIFVFLSKSWFLISKLLLLAKI